jgi:hypothetical protein
MIRRMEMESVSVCVTLGYKVGSYYIEFYEKKNLVKIMRKIVWLSLVYVGYPFIFGTHSTTTIRAHKENSCMCGNNNVI